MKALFISDIHLGNPFFKEYNYLLDLLENEEYDKIYFLGDIFDEWEMPFDVILNKYSLFCDHLRNKSDKIVFLIGNHDPSIFVLRKEFPKLRIVEESEFEGYKLIHGHVFDSLILSYYPIARYLFKFVKIFEKLGIDIETIFKRTYHSVSAKVYDKSYNDLILNIEKNAVSKYCANYKGVIMGHSHFPKITNWYDTVYMNCGDWLYNKTYISFSSEKGFELFRF